MDNDIPSGDVRYEIRELARDLPFFACSLPPQAWDDTSVKSSWLAFHRDMRRERYQNALGALRAFYRAAGKF